MGSAVDIDIKTNVVSEVGRDCNAPAEGCFGNYTTLPEGLHGTGLGIMYLLV